jgi:hypothetical protein
MSRRRRCRRGRHRARSSDWGRTWGMAPGRNPRRKLSPNSNCRDLDLGGGDRIAVSSVRPSPVTPRRVERQRHPHLKSAQRYQAVSRQAKRSLQVVGREEKRVQDWSVVHLGDIRRWARRTRQLLQRHLHRIEHGPRGQASRSPLPRSRRTATSSAARGSAPCPTQRRAGHP